MSLPYGTSSRAAIASDSSTSLPSAEVTRTLRSSAGAHWKLLHLRQDSNGPPGAGGRTATSTVLPQTSAPDGERKDVNGCSLCFRFQLTAGT
jgi:hypothetical protein